jgi:unsaturated rhamnogalacturonyl hydrolase
MTSQKTNADPTELLRLIARRTAPYDMSVWFWGDAIACDGLMEAAELGGSRPARLQVEKMLSHLLVRPLDWVDYLAPGGALMSLYRMTGNERWLVAAHGLAKHLRDYFPRARGGVHLYRPDLPAHRHSVFIDTLYHVPSFFASLGNVTGESAHSAMAIRSFRSHLNVLRSRKGPLLEHSFDVAAIRPKGYGWGRGQGWAVLGMADTLGHLDKKVPGYSDLTDRFRSLCETTLGMQDATGFWRTLMHDPEAYLESSTAAFMGAAYTKGVRLGLLPAKFVAPAELAWRAMLSRIDPRGGLFGVSAVTWAWVSNLEETTMYKSLPTEVNLWGQGAALRFCAERIRASLA